MIYTLSFYGGCSHFHLFSIVFRVKLYDFARYDVFRKQVIRDIYILFCNV